MVLKNIKSIVVKEIEYINFLVFLINDFNKIKSKHIHFNYHTVR